MTDFIFAHPQLRSSVLPVGELNDVAGGLLASLPLEDEIWPFVREAVADRSTQDIMYDQLRISVGTILARIYQCAVERRARRVSPQNRVLILVILNPDVKKADFDDCTQRINGIQPLLSELILEVNATYVQSHRAYDQHRSTPSNSDL